MAAGAGIKIVKFQYYDVESLISPQSPDWKKRLLEKQLDIGQLRELFTYALSRDMIPFSTAHDIESFRIMKSELDPPLFKIGSGEWRNHEYIEEICAQGKPVILSTGMYSHEDIKTTVKRVSDIGFERMILLHCVTSYPVPDKEATLRAIPEILDYFPGIVGYSDHTTGISACLAAIALGATVIEKHITNKVNIPNAQDWKASATAEELAQLVSESNRVSSFLAGARKPTSSELAAREWATKSLAYAEDFQAGKILKKDDFISIRPGTGIRPDEFGALVGKVLVKDVLKKHLVSEKDFE
jgi:N-acetylneuraminate synthase/N,N'-diacetyllegionaminate synthase